MFRKMCALNSSARVVSGNSLPGEATAGEELGVRQSSTGLIMRLLLMFAHQSQ